MSKTEKIKTLLDERPQLSHDVIALQCNTSVSFVGEIEKAQDAARADAWNETKQYKATFNGMDKFWDRVALEALLKAHFNHAPKEPAKVLRLLDKGGTWTIKHSTGSEMSVVLIDK